MSLNKILLTVWSWLFHICHYTRVSVWPRPSIRLHLSVIIYSSQCVRANTTLRLSLWDANTIWCAETSFLLHKYVLFWRCRLFDRPSICRATRLLVSFCLLAIFSPELCYLHSLGLYCISLITRSHQLSHSLSQESVFKQIEIHFLYDILY